MKKKFINKYFSGGTFVPSFPYTMKTFFIFIFLIFLTGCSSIEVVNLDFHNKSSVISLLSDSYSFSFKHIVTANDTLLALYFMDSLGSPVSEISADYCILKIENKTRRNNKPVKINTNDIYCITKNNLQTGVVYLKHAYYTPGTYKLTFKVTSLNHNVLKVPVFIYFFRKL